VLNASGGDKRIPVTAAVRHLRAAGVEVAPYFYEYVERGGTEVSAACLGVPEHHVIKTLIFEDEHNRPVVVLMQGDLEVSSKELARVLKVKSVTPCRPEVAERHSGYPVGGTSPFGLKKALPVYAEHSIRDPT
jgi:Cys-tRNA(Pro) deacylase